MSEDLETIDNWLKEEYGISYTELCQEFNGAVELNIKYLNKIAQKDEEIERLKKILENIHEEIKYLYRKPKRMFYDDIQTLKKINEIVENELKGVDKE